MDNSCMSCYQASYGIHLGGYPIEDTTMCCMATNASSFGTCSAINVLLSTDTAAHAFLCIYVDVCENSWSICSATVRMPPSPPRQRSPARPRTRRRRSVPVPRPKFTTARTTTTAAASSATVAIVTWSRAVMHLRVHRYRPHPHPKSLRRVFTPPSRVTNRTTKRRRRRHDHTSSQSRRRKSLSFRLVPR